MCLASVQFVQNPANRSSRYRSLVDDCSGCKTGGSRRPYPNGSFHPVPQRYLVGSTKKIIDGGLGG